MKVRISFHHAIESRLLGGFTDFGRGSNIMVALSCAILTHTGHLIKMTWLAQRSLRQRGQSITFGIPYRQKLDYDRDIGPMKRPGTL
jgi:hypothetical protein